MIGRHKQRNDPVAGQFRRTFRMVRGALVQMFDNKNGALDDIRTGIFRAFIIAEPPESSRYKRFIDQNAGQCAEFNSNSQPPLGVSRTNTSGFQD